jgi:hypothetical protein
VLDVFALNDPVQRFHDFLRVVQVEVLDMTLKARLRPPALSCAAGLDAFDFTIVDDLASRDDEDAR